MESSGPLAGKRNVRLIVAFLAAYGVDAVLQTAWFLRMVNHLPWGLSSFALPLIVGCHLTLYVATIAVIFSFVRRLASARGRAFGLTAAARRFPRLVHRGIHWIPSAIWFLATVPRMALWVHWDNWSWVSWFLLRVAGTVVGGAAMALVFRAGIRRALAGRPTDLASDEPVDPNATEFCAVAVTRTTRAAVATLAAVSSVVIGLVAVLPTTRLFGPAVLATVLAYIAAAFGAAAAMHRASRIVVGIDGVYVMGAGRARFYAWTAVDEVRADKADLVLSARGRVLVRLQLHSADAARCDALLARFGDAMAAAARARNEAPHIHAAHAASAAGSIGDRLASSARGAVDYRQPAIQREQLWEVVEGAAAGSSARTLAAEALAADLDDDERDRLRIAADHCAEPKVRVALQRLLEDDDEEPPARVAAHLPLR